MRTGARGRRGAETWTIPPTARDSFGRALAGPDPHEVVASTDGRTAYISNYGGPGSDLDTISVVDLVTQKALPAINLGALHSTQGLAFWGNKLYFTAETNKVVGRYDPASKSVDWVMGTGQDRTHMIEVSSDGEHIFTSNVASATISLIDESTQVQRFGPPPPNGEHRPGGNGPGAPARSGP